MYTLFIITQSLVKNLTQLSFNKLFLNNTQLSTNFIHISTTSFHFFPIFYLIYTISSLKFSFSFFEVIHILYLFIHYTFSIINPYFIGFFHCFLFSTKSYAQLHNELCITFILVFLSPKVF